MTSRQFIWLVDCGEDGNDTRPPPLPHPRDPAEGRESGGTWKHFGPLPPIPKNWASRRAWRLGGQRGQEEDPGPGEAGHWVLWDEGGGWMRDGCETRAPVKAHPHSAVSRCSEVWSPAPPPSARTVSGRSGTARTLWREAKWSSPPSAPARRTGHLPTAPTL